MKKIENIDVGNMSYKEAKETLDQAIEKRTGHKAEKPSLFLNILVWVSFLAAILAFNINVFLF